MPRRKEPRPSTLALEAAKLGSTELTSPVDSTEGRRWQETLDALASVQAGHGVPGEIVHAWLGGWGQASEKAPPICERRRKRLERYATWSEEEVSEFDEILAFQRQVDPDASR